MTDQELLHQIAQRACQDYMRNVDNLRALEKHIVNQRSFLDALSESLVNDGEFIEKLSTAISHSMAPVVENMIDQHVKECPTGIAHKALDKIVEEEIKEKKDLKKGAFKWMMQIIKWLAEIIIILTSLLLTRKMWSPSEAVKDAINKTAIQTTK